MPVPEKNISKKENLKTIFVLTKYGAKRGNRLDILGRDISGQEPEMSSNPKSIPIHDALVILEKSNVVAYLKNIEKA